ncbi:MAG: hypothetical protein ACM3SY_05205 [Candidatus Omnitrophota bacterium]
MNELYNQLASRQGTFDMMLDPEIGPMELQELGIEDFLEYNKKYRFAFADQIDLPSLQKLLDTMTENLGISDDENEVMDWLTEKRYKSYIEHTPVQSSNGFWVTFWYDARTGTLHRQGKAELFIRPHSNQQFERYDFYDTKKETWIKKIAAQCNPLFDSEMEPDELNDYIKDQNLLWLLEEILEEGYDIWDFLEDVNQEMMNIKK